MRYVNLNVVLADIFKKCSTNIRQAEVISKYMISCAKKPILDIVYATDSYMKTTKTIYRTCMYRPYYLERIDNNEFVVAYNRLPMKNVKSFPLAHLQFYNTLIIDNKKDYTDLGTGLYIHSSDVIGIDDYDRLIKMCIGFNSNLDIDYITDTMPIRSIIRFSKYFKQDICKMLDIYPFLLDDIFRKATVGDFIKYIKDFKQTHTN